MPSSIIDRPQDLSSVDLKLLNEFACQNGFRALTLLKASLLTGHPINFYYQHWETDQALRVWVVAQIHDGFLNFFKPLFESKKQPNRGDLADILDRYLDFVSEESLYFRVCSWAFLENDEEIQSMCHKTQSEFYSLVHELFRRTRAVQESKIEFSAYLFVNFWKTYASLIWSDSEALKKHVNLQKLKSDLKAYVIESVFEN